MGVRRHLVSAGLPRARASWRPDDEFGQPRCPQLPDKLPVPWINGTCVRDDGDWHSFRDDALAAAHNRQCVVCGKRIDGPVYLAAMSGSDQTSGMGGHGSCILLAVTQCPHLVELTDCNKDVVIAWRYEGDGPGCELPPLDDPRADWGGGEQILMPSVPLTFKELRADVRARRLASA